jgi:AcrR family transcriptional regulator
MLSMAGQRLSRDDRRAQLVGAAAAAFLAGGYDGTSMESVAEQAGVTRLIVYRHFDSKQALYRAVLDSVVDPLREEYAPDQPSGIGTLLLGIARRHPDAFRLLWRHARHEPTFVKEAEAFREIAAGFADGHIAAYVADPILRRWGAATIVDYLYGGICEWLDHGDARRDDDFAVHLQAGARALVTAWSAPNPRKADP